MIRASEVSSVLSWFSRWKPSVGQYRFQPKNGGSAATPKNTWQKINILNLGQYIANMAQSAKKPKMNFRIQGLKKALTPEELAKVDRWIATGQRVQALKEEVASRSLAESMVLAEQWFARQNGSEEARTVATQVVAGWQHLRGQMKKHSALG